LQYGTKFTKGQKSRQQAEVHIHYVATGDAAVEGETLVNTISSRRNTPSSSPASACASTTITCCCFKYKTLLTAIPRGLRVAVTVAVAVAVAVSRQDAGPNEHLRFFLNPANVEVQSARRLIVAMGDTAETAEDNADLGLGLHNALDV
jgi:hypothetical protein